MRNGKIAISVDGHLHSALTACEQVDARGAENVVLLFLPSQSSDPTILRDSVELAKNLKTPFHILSIELMVQATLMTLEKTLAPDELLQARSEIEVQARQIVAGLVAKAEGAELFSEEKVEGINANAARIPEGFFHRGMQTSGGSLSNRNLEAQTKLRSS